MWVGEAAVKGWADAGPRCGPHRSLDQRVTRAIRPLQARRLRRGHPGLQHHYYSDAIAIDTESAGVAEAAHRNDFHRVVVVRAISDTADGRKHQTDDAG